MPRKTPANVKDEIVRLKMEWLSLREIADIITTNFDYPIIHTTVASILSSMKNQYDTVDKLNKEIVDNDKYEIEDQDYVFYRKKTDWSGITERFCVPISFVDSIFESYSRYWKNLSGQMIMDKFELKPVVWGLLKSRLNLSKDSDIISPITFELLEQKAPEKIQEIIQEATYNNIKAKHKDKFKKTYDSEFKKEGKKAMKALANMESFTEHLQKYIKDYKPKLIHFERQYPENSDIAIYAMADLHLGMKWTDAILKRVQTITNDMINDKASNIHIINLWDLAETFVEWGMHPWQVEEMEGIYWFDLMMFVVENIESMIIKLVENGKTVSFTGISWNHDRVLQNHNQDSRRMWGLVVYEMIKRGLSNLDCNIRYVTEKINSRSIGGIHMITHHWDDGFSNKKPVDILWKHWVHGKENVIIHGDKHNMNIREEKEAIMIWLPALSNRGSYTKMLDLYSEPWYVRLQENEFGKVNVYITRLQ